MKTEKGVVICRCVPLTSAIFLHLNLPKPRQKINKISTVSEKPPHTLFFYFKESSFCLEIAPFISSTPPLTHPLTIKALQTTKITKLDLLSFPHCFSQKLHNIRAEKQIYILPSREMICNSQSLPLEC